MLTNLRLADLRLTTAQQRTTGQNLPSELYLCLSTRYHHEYGGMTETGNMNTPSATNTEWHKLLRQL
jgi:hypothetical protein